MKQLTYITDVCVWVCVSVYEYVCACFMGKCGFGAQEHSKRGDWNILRNWPASLRWHLAPHTHFLRLVSYIILFCATNVLAAELMGIFCRILSIVVWCVCNGQIMQFIWIAMQILWWESEWNLIICWAHKYLYYFFVEFMAYDFLYNFKPSIL